MNLRFVVVGESGSATKLAISGFKLNDASDEVLTIDGGMTVVK